MALQPILQPIHYFNKRAIRPLERLRSGQYHQKPKKPYPDFPLTAHATGQWCKKIKGRIYYFGTDPEAALQKYLDTRDAIQAGRQPENYNPEGCTLRDAVNSFLTMKQHRVDAGELSPLTLGDYKRTCEELISHFGRLRTISSLFPADFERLRTKLAKRLNPTSLGDFIRRSRPGIREVARTQFRPESIEP